MDLFGGDQQIFNLFDDDVPSKPKPQTSKPKKKNAKLDYAVSMQSAYKTPFKCKNHQGVNMKIRDYIKSSITCGSCGFKCQGKAGFISCPKIANCYNLCTVCRVCSKNHYLRSCVSLKQFQDKNPLYGENKFKCSGCDVEQVVGTEGVLFCPPCNFSICMNCINSLNEEWQRRALGIDEKQEKQQKKQ